MPIKSTIRWNGQLIERYKLPKATHTHKIEDLNIQINIQRNQTQKTINCRIPRRWNSRSRETHSDRKHPGRCQGVRGLRAMEGFYILTVVVVILHIYAHICRDSSIVPLKLVHLLYFNDFSRKRILSLAKCSFQLIGRETKTLTVRQKTSEVIPDTGPNGTHTFTALVQTENRALWERPPLTTHPAAPSSSPSPTTWYLPMPCWHLASCAFSFTSSSCSDWTWRSLETISLESWAIWASQRDFRADASSRSLNKEGKLRECGRGSHSSSLLQQIHTHTALKGNARSPQRKCYRSGSLSHSSGQRLPCLD